MAKMAFLKAEEKKVLLDHYLDFEWPDDVTDLRCVRCQRVVIIHYVSNCQHLYCNNCRRVLSDGGQWKCPQCQRYVTRLDDQNFDVEFKMHKLRIFCPNKKYGCKYEAQLRNIPKHLMTCVDTQEAALPVEYTGTNRIEAVDKQLTKVSAAIGELKEGLSEQVKKFDDINSQLNIIIERMNCIEIRSEELESASVTSTEEFKKKTTIVEKKVEGTELASKNHTEELQSIKSLLESINQRLQKIELLHQSNVDEMKTKMTSMSQEIEALHYKNSEESNIRKAETYEWTITDLKKSMAKDNWIFECEVFTFIGYKYDIKAKLEKKEGTIEIYLQFRDGDKINKDLNKIGFTRCKYIIRDQSNAQKKKDIICESDLRFYDCYVNPNWIFGYGLGSSVLSPPYLNDDCMKITISLEPASIDRSFVSNNGVLMWTVDNYKTKKQEQFYNSIWSPSFYTSPQGYRVRIRLIINYKVPMKLEVHFLTGEHDASLTLNFPHVITVTMFNQVDPSKNLVKCEKHDNVRLHLVQLESSESLEQNGFIKDDSLLLKVVIEPVKSK